MDHVEKLLARPRLYNNIDGLVELGAGAICLGTALLLALPANSVWHKMSWFILFGLLLATPHGIKAIKTHITYPRTGFVEYRKRWHTSAIAGAMGAMVTTGLWLAFRRRWDISMLGSLTGLAFAAAYAYHFASAVRWKWVIVGAMVAASFVIAFLPADVLAAMANDSLATDPARAKLGGAIVVSCMTYGAMLLISGGVSLWLYLRHTQAPRPEGQ